MVYADEKIYCQNPQCGREIEGDKISYDGKKPYHPGDCQRLASAYAALQSQGMDIMVFDSISRERALELMKDGRLEQSIRREGELEQKIKAGFFSRLTGFFER